MPDLTSPPPPPNVTSQMAPAPGGPSSGGPGLAGLMARLGGGGAGPVAPPPVPPAMSISDKVIAVQPLLQQLALQAPSLAPDVDALMTALQSRMGGAPPVQIGMAPPPVQVPPAVQPQGVTGIAMQLEVQLPAISSIDPTLAPQIQYFIAKMRDEVPKVDAMLTQNKTTAPTD